MKRTFLLLSILILTATISFGQAFEGIIVYENTYKSNIPQVSDQQWAEFLGTTQEYYYKEGKYKSVFNGDLVQWQLYSQEENKLYNKLANSETAFWNDGNEPGEEVIDVKVNKGVIEVLGYLCDEVVLSCKGGVQRYYYNSELAVDASLFSNHSFGNWYDYLSQANALPLKSIIESEELTTESIATAVNPIKLDDSEFELPAGIKTEKSPY